VFIIIIALAVLFLFSAILNIVLYYKGKKEALLAQQGLQNVLDAAPLICGIFDKDGNFITVNKFVETLYDIPDKQIYVDQFLEFLPKYQPDGQESFQKSCNVIKKAFDEGEARYEWTYQKQDGTPVETEEIGRRIRFGNRDVVVCYTIDIREHKNLIRNQELLQQGMQAVMDAAPMICGVFDKDGNFITVNKFVETLYGIPDRQIYVDHFEEFLPPYQPDGQPSFQKSCDVIKKAFDEGEARYEWTYQKQDGTPIETEEIGRRIKYGDRDVVVCYTRDVREYKRLREAEKLVQDRTQVMVEQLNGYIERQAAAVSQSSAAIEEMISNTRSVTDTLAKNAKNVEQLKEVSDVGRAGLNEVAGDIQEIARESESLLEINSVMQNIASQTNLLSMNAAIEAAHAGNVGKGFAVVADEIRKLAESSSNQSKTIGAVLKQIKASIDKITRSTGNVLDKFEAIDNGVKIVADQERMIFNAMNEQGRGSQQVLQGIAEVNEVTHQVKDASRQLLEGSRKT
jgi:PAS domain S-box-containing protein